MVERERKELTAASSHWGNRELERWRTIEVTRNERDCQLVNGVRLFSISTVNAALESIYELAGYEQDERFLFPATERERSTLYAQLVGGAREGGPARR